MRLLTPDRHGTGAGWVAPCSFSAPVIVHPWKLKKWKAGGDPCLGCSGEGEKPGSQVGTLPWMGGRAERSTILLAMPPRDPLEDSGGCPSLWPTE